MGKRLIFEKEKNGSINELAYLKKKSYYLEYLSCVLHDFFKNILFYIFKNRKLGFVL